MPSYVILDTPEWETQPRMQPRGRRKLEPALWAPNGFAVIPTAALDLAHSPASPTVPALIGSGSPSVVTTLSGCLGRQRGCQLGDRLELGQEFGTMLHEVANHPGVPEQFRQVALDDGQMQVVLTVRLLNGGD